MLDSLICPSALTDDTEPSFLGGGVTRFPLSSTKLLIVAVEPCLDLKQECFLGGGVNKVPSALTTLLTEPNLMGGLIETDKLTDSYE